jgi:hypothetical protein
MEEIRNKKQTLDYIDSANPVEIEKLQEQIKTNT